MTEIKSTKHKTQITNKPQAPSHKQITMNEITNNNNYDLEDRTLEFSKRIIHLVKRLPKNTANFKLMDQLVRSGTSIGANYREANDSISKKDFLHRMRISRKEARETTYWLELLIEANSEFKKDIDLLSKECKELRNILSAILTKSENKSL